MSCCLGSAEVSISQIVKTNFKQKQLSKIALRSSGDSEINSE